MNILYLTTEFPFPATSGGTVRSLSQLRTLAALPEVETIHVLSVSETPVDDDTRATFEASVPKLHVAPPVFHPVHLFDHPSYVARVLALRAMGVPYLAAKWDSAPLHAALKAGLSGGTIDVAYLDHLGMARYLGDVCAAQKRPRIVLEQHNVESDFFRTYANGKTGWKRLIAEAEWRSAAAFERRAMREVDAVVAISADDAARFRSMADVTAHVVPVVTEFSPIVRPEPDSARFCYVGNLRWHPNRQGLDWFCRDVWPLIRERLPAATFEIAGIGLKTDPQGRIEVPQAWQVPGVETIGFLENLEPLFARSLAVIAPILGGSGVRIKLLESFKAGIPVLTTPDGAAGLPIVHDRHLLVAANPSDFAAQAERLAMSSTLRRSLVDAAYSFLETEHSREAALRVMRNALGIPVQRPSGQVAITKS